jgi:NAD(P)-dependent dehydrogenase (short-subunit alcohol dehydrogenase family)
MARPARQKRIFLVTGAASGIGAALAARIVAAGDRVAIADIDLAGARKVAAALGDAAWAVKLDIAAAAQWESVLDKVEARFGQLDVLVNNAAIVHPGNAVDLPLAQQARTMAVNYLGPVTGSLAALRRFRAQGHGHIATVCSMTAFIPFPGLAGYAAAKHALRAFHIALALEERDGPVTFTIVHPSATETPMLEAEARSDAVALAFATPSYSADYVAGEVLKAIDARAFEAFAPPERGRIVRQIGISPRRLRKMVERNGPIGREKLAERRRRATTPQ